MLLTRTATIDKTVAACVIDDFPFLPVEMVPDSMLVVFEGEEEKVVELFVDHLVSTSEVGQVK